MLLGKSNLVYTDTGVRSVFDLYKDMNSDYELPKVLSYNEETNTNIFQTIKNIEFVKNIDLYKVSFSDQILAKTFNVECSLDTEFLLYNIITTTVEPIIVHAYNVYHYLKYNKPHYSLNWKPLSFMVNYAMVSPVVTLGDIVVKYLEKKLIIKDTAYKITFNDNEVDGRLYEYDNVQLELDNQLTVYLDKIHPNYNYENIEFMKIIKNGNILKLDEDFFWAPNSNNIIINLVEEWKHSDHIIIYIKEKKSYSPSNKSMFVASNINYSYNFVLVK